MARPTVQRLKWECDVVTPDAAVATTMVPKKNPADPTKSGTNSGKGKGRACQPSPTPEPSGDPDEPKFYAPLDLSDDEYTQPMYSPPPKKESKQARKARIEKESEQDFAVFEARHHAQQAPASQEEIDRLLACQTPQIELLGPPAREPKTSSASRPTSLWSENSDQYLQVPLQGGTSSGASSWASKRRRSPSPSSHKDRPPSAPRGRGSRYETRPPPGQLRRPSIEIEEEIRNLRMELKRHRDYGHQDQKPFDSWNVDWRSSDNSAMLKGWPKLPKNNSALPQGDTPPQGTITTTTTRAIYSVQLRTPDALTGRKNTAPTDHREPAPLVADTPCRRTTTLKGPHAHLPPNAPGSQNCLVPLAPHRQRQSPSR